MISEERTRLEAIDTILRSKGVCAQIRPVVERVRAELAQEARSLMSWEPIPLTIYGGALPPVIRSSWVFILRAGANTGAERHPNSHQRMMSFEGRGDLQMERPPQTSNIERRSKAEGKRSESEARIAQPTEQWESNVLVSERDAPLEKRWISVPPNVWHQAIVAKDADWVVISFHTVPAEELIEERPAADGAGGTKQTRYWSLYAP